MRKGIWIADRTGDQLLCTDGTVKGGERVRTIADDKGGVEVSHAALQSFFDRCIAEHGYTPMAAGRRANATEFELLHPAGNKQFSLDPERLRDIEEVLIAQPLVGG